MLYYGDKISPNMVKTPEGYLICKNVPLGRIGSMDYLGAEIPREFGVDANKVVKVNRKPEQLFSPETIASFEGKPVTNLHPSDNLTVDTAPYTARGHVQNVRQDGKYLIGDLYITDPGLVDEIENNRKREVSCGYDAGWKDNGDGSYEQVGILGNHVAVVPNGRAGHKVAIKDSKPEKNGGKKKMTMSKKFLTALGLKHFAQDAEPEEIAKAMDAMKEEKETKDAEPAPSVVEAATIPTSDEDPMAEVNAKIDKLMEIVGSLVESDKKVHENVAKESMDELEEELGSKPEEEETLEDEEEETPETQEKEKEEGKEQHVFASDEEAVKKIVKDMKPIIMGIKDEKLRNEVAQKFVKSVRDSRTVSKNDYGNIMSYVANNQRKAAKDSATVETFAQRGVKAVDAWNKAAQNLKGGNK